MKKYGKNIILLLLVAAILVGLYASQFRTRSLQGADDRTEVVHVRYIPNGFPAFIEVTDMEKEVLLEKLLSLKLKWSGGFEYPVDTEHADYYLNYVAGHRSWHIYLDEACGFAYQSTDDPKAPVYMIIQNEAYTQLMEALRSLIEYKA